MSDGGKKVETGELDGRLYVRKEGRRRSDGGVVGNVRGHQPSNDPKVACAALPGPVNAPANHTPQGAALCLYPSLVRCSPVNLYSLFVLLDVPQ